MKNKKTWLLLAALMLVFVLLSNNAEAANPTSGELKAQLEALEEEKESLAQQLDNLQGKYADNQTELEGMISQKANLDQQIFLLNQDEDFLLFRDTLFLFLQV
jgi:predicted nuclease with TOPRIM domain